MRSLYIRLPLIATLFSFLILSQKILASNDTISTFPFIEDWSSGSFDTNHWTFPYGQGNWTILTGDGHPAPCAAFTGDPTQTNYGFSLETALFDTRHLLCDDVFLDFDLALQNLYTTGTERMYIIFQWYLMKDTLLIVDNTDNISWNHYHFELEDAGNKLFKIIFQVKGVSSNNFSDWEIDNISISRKCRIATNMAVDPHWVGSLCINSVAWLPPECNQHEEEMTFIFDDGTGENSYRGNPGEVVEYGNYFPIEMSLAGEFTSFDLYMKDNGSGTPQTLRIEIYDGSQVLVGESDEFTGAPFDEWITVSVPPIPFAGPFYAMVKWNNITGESYFLAADDDGPYSMDNLYYKFDEVNWSHPSSVPSVFLLRATAMVQNKLIKLTSLFNSPGIPASDSVLGYDIYKLEDDKPDTVKLNSEPISTPYYNDTIPPGFSIAYYYSVKAIYNDSCVSDFSDWVLDYGCCMTVQDRSVNGLLKISPNPASRFTEVTSESSIIMIRLYNSQGLLQFKHVGCNDKRCKIDVSGYPAGLYYISITTSHGSASQKIVVVH
ncbi:MAG TPA: T9SS type A sorting domain-containing protein [Bacteroidales bacterium]|nr:T9SS type A sorting domain-containing protein [Bacteroidales bacterium]